MRWELDPDKSLLHIDWAESGGPAVSRPAATGYGTKLIQSATAYTLGGHVSQDYAPSGLRTEIVIPFPPSNPEDESAEDQREAL